jgi:hypothetical protein
MSYNAIFIDLDRAKLKYLLKRLRDRELTQEEAIELKPLLEKIWKSALKIGDSETARKVSDTLIGLNGYIRSSSSFKEFVNIANIV